MTVATGARPCSGFTGHPPACGVIANARCAAESSLSLVGSRFAGDATLFLCGSRRQLNSWPTRLDDDPGAAQPRAPKRYAAETKRFARHIGQLHGLPTLHSSEVERECI